MLITYVIIEAPLTVFLNKCITLLDSNIYIYKGDKRLYLHFLFY